jgi:predicted TIM-barrel fold metal-dependent hydrolase
MDRSLRIFDAHFHIIDPRFPLYPNQGFLPEPFTVEDYRARVAHLGVVGGAVVSASFQGSDQSHLVDALSRLGDGFVGVTQLPPTVTDAEIAALGDVGVRALRFNLYRGGSAGLEHLDRLARRVHEVAGWHVELYVDSADLPELGPRLKGLPGVVMDHLGLTSTGFDELLRLVEGGAWVKATGFGRVRLDVPDALRALYRANPGAIVFGTDLPSTRARRPFADSDIDLIQECLGEDGAAKVLAQNGLQLYGVE